MESRDESLMFLCNFLFLSLFLSILSTFGAVACGLMLLDWL